MGLFTTKTRRTYHRPQAKRGWSTTLTAKTRLKRWAKRRSKQLWRTTKRRAKRLWRTTKQRVRRRQRQRQRAIRKRQIARRAQQFRRHNAKIHQRRQPVTHRRPVAPSQAGSTSAGGYQVGPDGTVSYQPSPGGSVEGRAKLPPPDGTKGNCPRCHNVIRYNGARERWEHIGRNPARGHYECFQPRREFE